MQRTNKRAEKMRVFASWSGGKDSALACYRAMLSGFEVAYLLTFVDEDGKRSRSHGISAYLLGLQAEALGIPIVQVKTTWGNYERDMKAAVAKLKLTGVEGGIFGDIDIEEHREWTERICSEMGIEAISPLWGQNPEELMRDFINAGFEAYVIATTLGERWLGRKIDTTFIKDIIQLDSHPCGEWGEYHTFVTNGPPFKRGITLTYTKKIARDNTWCLDIAGVLSKGNET